MSGFSVAWLDLREPVDAASRSSEILCRLQALAQGTAERRILDLASGTGANLRYLAPRLGGRQQWLLVDHDAALLAELPRRVAAWAAGAQLRLVERGEVLELSGPGLDCRLRRQTLDLASDLDRLDLEGQWLVTASALLDLVSGSWLTRLADRCRAVGACALFALSYDGRIACHPPEAGDERLRELVNRHQRSDKGFGPALGPDAAALAPHCFAAAGYRVLDAASDWDLGGGDTAIQSELVADWAAAATTIAPAERAQLAAWSVKRRSLIARGCSRIEVGHRDLLAWPS